MQHPRPSAPVSVLSLGTRSLAPLALTLASALAIAGCSPAPSPGGGGGSGSGGRAGTGGATGGSQGAGGRPSGGAGGSSSNSGGSPGAGGASNPGGSGGTSNPGGSGGSSGSGGTTTRPDAGPTDMSTPGDTGGEAAPPPPAGDRETYVATALSPGTGQRTDRRPISVGFYDATANKTFVSWMGPGSDALVREYNHATKTWSADKVAGNATFADKHNYPAMVRGKDNRLYVFYGCHNTPLRMAVSPNPLSIEGTWRDGNVGAAPDASYPAPIVTTDGTMYVFIRLTRAQNGHTDDRPLAYIKSTNNGQSWSRVTVLDTYPRSDNLTEIYNGKISHEPAHGNQKEKIHIAWTLAGGGPGNHEHDAYTRNVYYAYLDPSTDRLYSVTGRDLGPSIDNNEGEMYLKAVDTGCSNCAHQAGYQVSVHYNDDGTPLIVYGHEGRGLTAVRWSNNAWVSQLITTAGGEPREINKFGARSFQVFRTTGNTCVGFRSVDGGATWSPDAVITAPHPVQRCHVIDNHHPDVKIFMEQNPEASGGGTSTARVTEGYLPPYKHTP
ncbi:MAG TPA: BNR-4 repeat-containing protein [Polyangia bacterium]